MSILESLWRRILDYIKPPLRIVQHVYLIIYRRAILLFQIKQFKVAKFKKMKTLKLNVGCGQAKYSGWVNIDIEPGADLVVDVRKGLPFDSGAVDFIYCEHVLEHFTYEEGVKVLREFYRCLKAGGILRIAMPDLDDLIQKYNMDWKTQDWLSWSEHKFIKTRGQMLNISFRWWGHKYLYNEEDLGNQLVNVRFCNITRCDWNKSNYVELAGLETRKDTKLIMEAVKE